LIIAFVFLLFVFSCSQFDDFKLIYRRYAGLFFIFAVDVDDNELLMMETIHLFVELLDQYFSNVCELDIVFNFNKVCGPVFFVCD
jgi:AP-2 complex subunit sigma-1